MASAGRSSASQFRDNCPTLTTPPPPPPDPDQKKKSHSYSRPWGAIETRTEEVCRSVLLDVRTGLSYQEEIALRVPSHVAKSMFCMGTIT